MLHASLCTYYDDNNIDIVLQKTIVNLRIFDLYPVKTRKCLRTYGILNVVGWVLF